MIRFKIERKPITMTVLLQKSIQMTVEKAATVGVASRTYEGSYEVIPKVEGQSLPTKDKYMKDNVNIHAIPFYEVSNSAGGTTIYIGSEDELIIE